MDNQNEPFQEDENQTKLSNTWIYIAIIVLLLGTNVYLFFQKRSTTQKVVEVEKELVQTTSERDEIKLQYEASLVRLDDLMSNNEALQKALASETSEVAKAKARIESILKKSNATERELAEARGLIKTLNLRIDSYEQEIADLKSQNTTLRDEKDSVISSNIVLQDKIELAKILHASNIRLQAIDLRRGGRRQKETVKARRVDLLRIVFDIDENRVANTGEKELFIRIIDPNGDLLSNAALGSSSFRNKHGNMVFYSLSKKINLQTGVPVKDIIVDWRQSADYEKGHYRIEIFYEHTLIGKGSVELK